MKDDQPVTKFMEPDFLTADFAGTKFTIPNPRKKGKGIEEHKSDLIDAELAENLEDAIAKIEARRGKKAQKVLEIKSLFGLVSRLVRADSIYPEFTVHTGVESLDIRGLLVGETGDLQHYFSASGVLLTTGMADGKRVFREASDSEYLTFASSVPKVIAGELASVSS